MEAPTAGLRPISPPTTNVSRVVGLILAGVLNLGIVYALVTGLASDAVRIVIANIKVAVIPPPPDTTKPPPPPPPTMKEPPPFVPPPDINIDITEAAPPTTAITNTSTTVTPAPVVAPQSSDPKALNSHAVTDRDYPTISVRMNEEGRVTVKYLVDANGDVQDVQITQSSGKDRLDQAAIPIVKRWRFKPALQEGKPVPKWQAAVVVFRLH